MNSRQRKWAVTCVFLALALRLPTLTLNSLWFDELFSVTIMTANAWDALRIAFDDIHPPLFNALGWLWVRVFGDSEAALRLYPATFSMLAVVAALTFRNLGNVRTRLILATVIAVLPAHIYYAQEVRSYTLVFLCTLWVCDRFIAFSAAPTRKNTVWLAAACAVLIATHYAAGLTVLAIGIASLIWVEKDTRGRWVRTFWLAVTTALLCTPLLPHIFHLPTTYETHYNWAPPVGLWGIRQTLMHPFYVDSPSKQGSALAVGIALVLGAALFRAVRTPGRRVDASLLMICGLPCVLAVTLSLLTENLFIPRVSMLYLAPAIVLVARELGLWQPRRAQLAIVFLGVMSVASLNQWQFFTRATKPDCRGIMNALAGQLAEDRDAVVASLDPGWAEGSLAFYPRSAGIDRPIYRRGTTMTEAEFVDSLVERSPRVVAYHCVSPEDQATRSELERRLELEDMIVLPPGAYEPASLATYHFRH